MNTKLAATKSKQHWAHFYKDKECTDANETDCIAYDGTFKQNPQWLIDQYVSKGEDDWQAIRFIHANKKTTYTVYRPSTLFILHNKEDYQDIKTAFKGSRSKTYDSYSFHRIPQTNEVDVGGYAFIRYSIWLNRRGDCVTLVSNPSPAAILMASLSIDIVGMAEVDTDKIDLFKNRASEAIEISNLLFRLVNGHVEAALSDDKIKQYPSILKANATAKAAMKEYTDTIKRLLADTWNKFEQVFKR